MPKHKDRQRAGFADAPRLLTPVGFNGHLVAVVNPTGCVFAPAGTSGAPRSCLRLRAPRGMPGGGSPRVPGQEGSESARVCSPFRSGSDSSIEFFEFWGGGLGAERALPRRAPACPGSPRKSSWRGDAAPRDVASGAAAGRRTRRPKIPPAFPTGLILCGRALPSPVPDAARQTAAPVARGEGRGTRWPWPARPRAGAAGGTGRFCPRCRLCRVTRVSVFRALDKGKRYVNANYCLILSPDQR